MVPIQSLAVWVGDCREKFVKYIQFLAGYDRYMYERDRLQFAICVPKPTRMTFVDMSIFMYSYTASRPFPYLFSLIQPAPPELNPVLPMLPPQKTFSARSCRRVIPYSQTFIIFKMSGHRFVLAREFVHWNGFTTLEMRSAASVEHGLSQVCVCVCVLRGGIR